MWHVWGIRWKKSSLGSTCFRARSRMFQFCSERLISKLWQSKFVLNYMIHIYCSFHLFFDVKVVLFFFSLMKHKWLWWKAQNWFLLEWWPPVCYDQPDRSVTLSRGRYGKPENTRPRKLIMFQLHCISFTMASPRSLMSPLCFFFPFSIRNLCVTNSLFIT